MEKMDLNNLEAVPGRPAPEFKVFLYFNKYFLYKDLNFNIYDNIHPYSGNL